MDLKQHVLRHMAFSTGYNGPGEKRQDTVALIHKTLTVLEEGDGESPVWAELLALALDGLTRRLSYVNGKRIDPDRVAEMVCNIIRGQQSRREENPNGDG